MVRRILVSIAIAIALIAPLRADDLAAEIAKLIGTSDYAHSRWGYLFVDAATGSVVAERNADQFFLPASTTKLYSCSSALFYLKPDSKFETPVYRRGTLEKGVLRGDLIMVASGDLTLGGRTLPDGSMAFANKDHSYADPTSPDAAVTPTDPLAGLKELARQVKAAGIDRVRGDVLVDDRLFDTNKGGSGSGPDLVTPVIVNDNVIDVIVSAGPKAGEAARYQLRPETETLRVDFQVQTTAEGGKPNIHVDGAGRSGLIIRGTIPEKSKPLVRIHPVHEPTAFARSLVIECLRHAGVEVSASPLQDANGELPERNGYGKPERVALFTSPPFSEAIKVTLKVSQNLYASTLPMLVAAKHGERTLADGLRRQGLYLRLVGVDAGGFSFAGGAGGKEADATTPRATVQLLTGLQKRPEWDAIELGLPILGVDGTLFGMVPAGSPVYGKVHAKTGTLWWDDLTNERSLLRSKALAGTLVTAKGRKLIFAMFVNDVPLPPGVLPTREGMLLGKICELVYLNAG
jgi:serine-type D-Ala-D-Ala carboxypeptidase/endopeptidase (penicillin-binding protein 4)